MKAPRRKAVIDLMDKASPLYKHAAWYLQSLRAAGRMPNTIAVYVGAIHELDKFLAGNALPRDLASIDRDHVEQFMLDQHTRLKPSTAASRYAGLRSFFTWAVDQGQIETSPIAKMPPPRIPEVPVPVLTDDQVKAILRACDTESFMGRRGLALIRFMLDTGARRSEVAAVRLDDVDLTTGTVWFKVTKGNHPRVGKIGAKTCSAIYAYLIERDKQRYASEPFLWIGQYGGLSGDVIGTIFSRRAGMAEVYNVTDDGTRRPAHAHQTRHTFADRFLAAGGSEGNLMALGGWRSREIMSRYGRSRATERALEEAARIAVGDLF